MSEKAAQIAEDAALLISEQGLTKHIYHDVNGYCIRGAVYHIAGIPNETHARLFPGQVSPAVPDVFSAVKHLIGGRAISTWNDRPETTKEDVVLILKRAAGELRR